MRIATFRSGGRRRVGSLSPDGKTIRPFDLGAAEELGALAVIERGLRADSPSLGASIPTAGLVFDAPIPRPRRNIFCVGKNYHEHAHEFAKSGFDSSAASGAVPEAPIVFTKVPECVIAPGAAIEIDPAASTAIDYEAELAIVIGKGGRGIKKVDALKHVWGCTIVNDVTARDLQAKYKQWDIGKSQDTFCPMGPVLVSADEVDIANIDVKCWVNGELRQDSNTSLLIFDIPTLIETISAGITLYPGDIIATGTPVGVGIGFNPPKYLKHGDTVKIALSGIGVLENPVRQRGVSADAKIAAEARA
ncbi:fumarylacetoacetate hydrolase family protein [Dongia sedimenti]|uniref:Fumarylacetoacetate hydrolase family protein n=1 Tax=Dongia sedimenti TaxID=3064282 RepID=A0ABU0YK20_9PROT|nr:fumarylacetoacetate hydrolase family protein [Rhodospirillaceae bacterium R-7]